MFCLLTSLSDFARPCIREKQARVGFNPTFNFKAMNKNKNAKSKNKRNFLNRYDNMNKFILKRKKIECISLNISILYLYFFNSSTQNYV